MKFLNRLITKFFIVITGIIFIGANVSSVGLKKVIRFDDKVQEAQSSCENVYYELLKQGHFGKGYANNLIINTSFDYSFVKNGEILLNLIEHLEKKDDIDSAFLLKKINKFFCLKFHKHLCDVSVPREDQADVWGSFHNLYRHKVEVLGEKQHPFRSALTKIMIFIFMVDFSYFDHQSKQEGLVYGLEKVKRDMLAINKTLGFGAIDTLVIKEFIGNIQLYGIDRPLVTSGGIRRITLWFIVGAATLALVGYIALKVIPNRDEIWDGITARLNKFSRNISRSLVEEGYDVVNEKIDTEVMKKFVHDSMGEILDDGIKKGVDGVRVIADETLPKVLHGVQSAGDNLVQQGINGVDVIMDKNIPKIVGATEGLVGNLARSFGDGFRGGTGSQTQSNGSTPMRKE